MNTGSLNSAQIVERSPLDDAVETLEKRRDETADMYEQTSREQVELVGRVDDMAARMRTAERDVKRLDAAIAVLRGDDPKAAPLKPQRLLREEH